MEQVRNEEGNGREGERAGVYGREFKYFLLAHHPRCERFEEDTIPLCGSVRLCIGCAISYPLCALTILLLFLFRAAERVSVGILVFAALLLSSFQLTSLLGLARRRGLKVGIKALLGLGMGLGIYAILNLPWSLVYRWLILCAAFLTAGGLYVVRIRNMKKRCSKCEWEGNWEQCPGFNLGKNGGQRE